MSKICKDVNEPVAKKALKDLLRFFKSSLQFLIMLGFFFIFFILRTEIKLSSVKVYQVTQILLGCFKTFFFISGYFLELFWKCNFLFDP